MKNINFFALVVFAALNVSGCSKPDRNVELAQKATSNDALAEKIVSEHLDPECGLHGAYARHFAELRDLGVSLDYATGEIRNDNDGKLKLFAEAIYKKSINPLDEFYVTYRECMKYRK